MNTIKRLAVLFLTMLVLLPCLSAAEDGIEMEEVTETGTADGTVTEKDGWHFDAKGFLTGENPGEEYLLEDEENGVWQYASKELSVKITRTREKNKKKRILEYCVADIWCSPESPMGAIMTEPFARYGGTPVSGKRQDDPDKLMSQNPSILAVSDDMYGLRIIEVNKKQTKYDYHGVIIRYGDVKATKTRKHPEEGKKDRRPWPNLDTLAVYQDGSMKAYVCDAKTAEEYLAEGALHVFAFGPWLISDGKMNEALQNKQYYPATEPRVAMGMIEPYHYIILAVSGRPTEKYTGVKLLWLAEQMQALGCVEALNLDGGGTVLMAFNNKVILKGDHRKNERNVGSLIVFGLQ